MITTRIKLSFENVEQMNDTLNEIRTGRVMDAKVSIGLAIEKAIAKATKKERATQKIKDRIAKLQAKLN